MPWVESHSVLIRHRKLKEFARALSIKPVTALGHLHCLWHTAIEQAEDGDLSKWTEGAICDAAQWEGNEKEFLNASYGAGFMDKGQLLHDWLDYAGKYLTSKYKTSKPDRLTEIWAKFGKIYGKEVNRNSFRPPKGAPPNLTLPNQPTKPANPIGDWFSFPFFSDTWNAWEKARKKKAGERQYKQLEKLSHGDMTTAISILSQSADNQWVGLFELKKTKPTYHQPQGALT